MTATLPDTVEACQTGMSAAVRAGDWLRYLQLRARWHALENASEPVQPAPEHTTRDPWPDGFDAPTNALRFKIKAETAGWDTRIGYARSSRKSVGRGIYKLHHYVTVQAARQGRSVWARWRRPVTGSEESAGKWSFDAGSVNGWPSETLTMVTDAVAAAAVESAS